MPNYERAQLKYTGTALPGNAETVNMFNSTLTGVRGFLSSARASRFEVTLQNSQAGSLLAYWSDDFGTNWNLYDTQVVGIPAAGASAGPYDYSVDPYKDWKLDWLNGAAVQTVFRVNQVLISGYHGPAT